MGSLVKLFVGQRSLWNLGKTTSVFLSYNQSSNATARKNQELKRPPGPFALFMVAKQAALREQYPHLRQTKIVKLASSIWKTESDITKQQYTQEHARLFEEYRKVRPVVIKEKEKELPRRPPTPFVQFLMEKNSSLQYQYPRVADRSKQARELWKNLSIVEKQRYKSKYINQFNTYTNNLSEEERVLIQERNKKERKAQRSKQQQQQKDRYGEEGLKERPNAPIRNPYIAFIKEKCEGIPDNTPFLKYKAQQWRNMSPAEKMVYEKQVNKAVKIYEEELAEWEKKYDRFPQE